MNCCNTYGQCTQGPGCAARTSMGQGCAPEGGNYWPAQPEPVELDVFESIAIYCTLAILSVISLGLLVAGAVSFYHLFF